jgi:RecA/RadA recombinase
MAKTKTKATKEYTFEDLNNSLSEIAPMGSTMDVSTFSEISEYISMGSRILNLCMTGSVFGGIPNNRAVELMGPSGVGKTFVMLCAAKNAQLMGYKIYWYDSENAVDKKLMEQFGIDVSQVWYEPCNTVEGFRHSVYNLTDKLVTAQRDGYKIPKVMIFLDSIGNLGTLKEHNDAESGSTKEDMTRAKRIKSLFRILMTKMAEVKVPFLYSNHTYKTTDFHAAWKGSGGSGREYGASIILMLTKAKLKDKKKENQQVGIVLTAKPNKNRFAKPNIVKTHLDYTTGLNEFTGLQDYMNWGWNDHGVEKGSIITAKALKKKSAGPRGKAVEFKCKEDLENGIESTMYFVPEKNATTIAVKDLGKHLTAKEFFSDIYWTHDRLVAVDAFAKPLFNYGVDDELPEDELFDVDNAEADLDA